MRRMMVVFAGALAVIAMTSGVARAQSIRTGGLTCETGPRVGLVVGSRQNMRCVFRSNTSGQEYTYTGRIGRIVLDLGISGGGRLFWAVFAPTSRVRRSTLVGTYVGARVTPLWESAWVPTCLSEDPIGRYLCSRCQWKASSA
jgi:uncharacterized protein DUF992